ncbi:T9SS type B sorting domain-containing protein [Aquimarina agarilytica]|uniref:T9SS type B sorting domain-containing protein n=1 Tax=Aquimarina agarilytica TaxID=1087449 RepID=UPI0002889AE7|nr:T9SS type B sorting domain-containing protein [Aquimarina agarilytica]
MEKHLLKLNSKLVSLLLCLVVYNLSYSQEFVPLSERANEVLRGDMAIIGNGVLGIRGQFDGAIYNPNDAYNGNENNGVSSFNLEQVRNEFGQLLYVNAFNFLTTDEFDFFGRPHRLYVRNSGSTYKRAYIDIDSDPAFASNFSAAFRANPNNSEYSDGNAGTTDVDANGTPLVAANNGTFSSSASLLDFNDSCSTVRKAFIYWSGVYTNETFDNGAQSYDPFTNTFSTVTSAVPRNRFCGTDCEDYTEIKILPPGGDQYYDISINPGATSNPNGIQLQTEVIVDGKNGAPFNIATLGSAQGLQDEPYVCVADVTDLFTSVQNNGGDINGFWTVGNVRATTGYRRFSGLTGGWTLAVIYEDNRPSTTNKAIYFYDGYSAITNSGDRVEFNTPTFQTIPQGPIRAWIGSTALEGDRSLTRDQFSIQTATTEQRLGADTVINLSDAPSNSVPLRENNPIDNTGNFFNSTITNLNGFTNKLPNSRNLLGYDTDHYELINTNNRILNNGNPISSSVNDTTASLFLSTDQDSYSNSFVAFAVEVIAPDVVVLKQAFNADTGALLANNEIVDFGQEIIYEMTIRNLGNDIAENILFEDLLPGNTELLDNQFTNASDFSGFDVPVPNVQITDETITDRAGITYSTKNVRIDIPDLGAFDCANQPSDTTTGETITDPACGQEVTVRFRVKIVDECAGNRNACVERVENIAFASFDGRFNDNRINQKNSAFAFDSTCDEAPIEGPTVEITQKRERCESQVTEICTGAQTLTAALGFDTYVWYFIPGPISDQNANGVIDDADFDITDGTEVGRFTSTATTRADNSFEVNDIGYYIVDQLREPLCANSRQTFNVVDGSELIANPFEDATLNPSRQDACSVDGEQITKFVLCNTDLTINTNYSDGTTLVWERFDVGSCTRPDGDNDCPFIGPGCTYTAVQTSTVSTANPATSQFVVDETASFRLTVTEGGCTNIFYFNTTKIDSNLTLSTPTGTLCGASNGTVVLNGLTAAGIGVDYELEYLIQDPANAANYISQDTQVATDTDYGTFTVNRPSPFREFVNIRVTATPDLSSGTDTSACTFSFDRTIRFGNPTIEVFEFSREPSCGVDQLVTDTFDDTLADILVRANDDLPNYFFQLINTNGTASLADDVVVATENTTNRQFTFEDVAPGIEYKVRVFANSEAASLPTVALNTSQCQVEAGPISTSPLPTFTANYSIQKQITCTPGEILITIASSDPTYDLNTVNFELNAVNTTTSTTTRIIGGTGASTTLQINDISQQPTPPTGSGDPADPDPFPDTNYVDIDSFDQFSLVVFVSNACTNDPIPLTNTFTAYEGIQLVEDVVEDIDCDGDTDGSISVTPQQADGSAYPSGTSLVYELISGPASLDASRLNVRQADRLFTNLSSGDYEIIVTDITNATDECPSEPITVTIDAANPLSVPVITATPYTCENQATTRGTISVTGGAAVDVGGATPYAEFRLFRDDLDATNPPNPIQVATSTDPSLAFENLTEGSYTLIVEDANGCLSEASLAVEIAPLSTVTFGTPTNPTLTCDKETATVQVMATADNGDTIEGYRIKTSNPTGTPTTPVPVTATFDNTTGEFELPEGSYTIEARSATSLCVEEIDVTIEALVRITSTQPATVNTTCQGATDGSATTSVSGFDTSVGYTYVLTLLDNTVTPAGRTEISNVTAEMSGALSFTGLAVGDYELVVTDTQTNCDETELFSIGEPATRPVVTFTPGNFNCATKQFNIRVSGSGGAPGAYQFQLDDPATAVIEFPFQIDRNFNSIPTPTTTSLTYSLSIRDVNGCIGDPVDVTIDPATDLDAEINISESNFCYTGTTDASIVIDILSGTPPFRYRRVGETRVNNIIGTKFTVIYDAPGTYEIEITDRANQLCPLPITIEINEPLSVTNIVQNQPDCRPAGAVPNTGASISFDVAGGDGTYVYVLQNTSGGTDPSGVTNSGTATSPVFAFNDNFNGDTIEINVIDGENCAIAAPITFTPTYPEAPVVLSDNATAVNCSGDDSIITLIPAGTLPVTAYEYSFDGGTTYQDGNNEAVTVVGTVAVNYVIRNRVTQCTVTGTTNITAPDPIVETNRVITPVNCDPVTLGSFELTISGGTANYSYELFNDMGTSLEVQSGLGTTVTFSNLDIGSYSVRVTDANNCTNENPIQFIIPPTPRVDITRIRTLANCVDGVTVFFQIDAVMGLANPDLFRISPFSLDVASHVFPSAPGDNIARSGDPDFLATDIPTEVTSAVGYDPAEFVYRISNLDFDISYSIGVIDDATGCSSSSATVPEPSPNVTINSVIPTPTGACDPNSGSVTVNFDVSDPTSVGEDYNIEVFRVSDGALVSPTPTVVVTSATATNNEATVTGIPEGILRIRVQQVTGGSVCNATQEFNVGRATPLEGPFIVNNVNANCTTDAQIEVRASGGQPPYEYRVIANGAAAPNAASSFPLSSSFSIAINDPRIVGGEVDVYVKDVNGCVSGPLDVPIDEDPAPILNVAAFSADECNETGPFTVNFTIENYDPNPRSTVTQTYDLSVNGSPVTYTTTGTTATELMGTFQVTSRQPYTVEVAGTLHPTCTDTDSFRIFERLVVDANLAEPDCANEIATITTNISNGFAGVPTRSLTYELVDAASPTTILATQTTASTSVTFTSGTGSPVLALQAGITYEVRVTDTFDPSAAAPRVCTVSDDDSKTVITNPVLVAPDTQPVSCEGTADGEIKINIDGSVLSDTPPLTYRLYEFATQADAQAAITASNVTSAGILVTTVDGSDATLFTQLKGMPVYYVPVLIATSRNCEITGTEIGLENPVNTTPGNFTIAGVDGKCDDLDDANNFSAKIEITVASLAQPTSSYVYTIPGVVNSETALPAVGTMIEVLVGSDGNFPTTYNVLIRDTSTTCDPISIPVEIAPCPPPVPLPPPLIVGNPVTTNIDCTGDADGTVSIAISRADGDPFIFDYTITGGTPSTTTTVTGQTTSPISETGLTPGSYTISIVDKSDSRRDVFAGTVNFTITEPDSLPDFTFSQTAYDCVSNTVTIVANAVSGSGTPDAMGNYTFNLDNAATAANPDFTNTTGVFANVPAPTVPGGTAITYQLTMLDANTCDTVKDVMVDPQQQLAATLNTGSVCLPNGTTTADAEVQITITSGTAPYRYRRVDTAVGATPTTPTFTTLGAGETIITDVVTAAANYEYELVDANSCPFVIPFSVNEPLSLNGPISRVEPDCIVPAAMPQLRSNGTYNFAVQGGTGTGTYRFEVAQGSSPTTLGAFIPYTGSFPFMVDSTQDGVFFQFRVFDGNDCPLNLDPFVFDFPVAPTATATATDILCVGDSGVATITPAGGMPPYTYSYDNGVNYISRNTLTEVGGTYDYIVRDAKGCEFNGQVTIEDRSIRLSGTPVITDITCTSGMPSTNNGAIEVTIVGGDNSGPGFTYTLRDNTGANLGTQVIPDRTVSFPMLEAGTYSIEVTDANPCAPVVIDNLTIETITPLTLTDATFDIDCTSPTAGTQMVFSVLGNTGTITITDPKNTVAGFINPTTNTAGGDNIHRFGDADFPSFFVLVPGTPAAVTDTFYAITGLDANTTYTISVFDSGGSGCIAQREYTTPPSGVLTITNVSTVPESSCLPNSGSIEVTFETDAGSTATDFDIEVLDGANMVIATGTGSPINVPGTGVRTGVGTVTGLGAGVNYSVRVTESGNICGDSQAFTITTAAPLGMPRVDSQQSVNCDRPTNVEIEVSATGGIMPYRYAVVAGTDTTTPPAVGAFTFDGTTPITIDTVTGTSLDWVLWVSDTTTCTPTATTFTIDNDPTPDLTIDPEFSIDQCEDGPSFTVNVRVDNYDPAFEPYTFTINDGVSDNIQTLNNRAITGTAMPGIPTGVSLTGELEVPRGTFTITVANKDNCNNSDSITVFDALEIVAELGEVQCDDTITNITAEVTGGFTGVRMLTYELFEAGNTTAINSQTIAVDNVTFTGSASGAALATDTFYTVKVTDDYGGTVGAPMCMVTSDPVRKEAINNSSLAPPTVSQITCNGDTDGSITLNLVTPDAGDAPLGYRLFRYPTQAAADAAVAANAPGAGVVQTASATPNENVFTGLATGFYVDFVVNLDGTLNCLTANTVTEITEPEAFTGGNISQTPTAGTCAPDVRGPFITISINANTGVGTGTPPYFYRIPGVINEFTEIVGSDMPIASGTTIDVVIPVDASPTGDITYTVEYRDSGNAACNTIPSRDVIITPFTQPVVSIDETASFYTCLDQEIKVDVTGLATDQYEFVLVEHTDTSGTATAVGTVRPTTLAPGILTYTFTQAELLGAGIYTFEVRNTVSGCSDGIDYVVRDLEQLLVLGTGNTLECPEDLRTISFDVVDYTGFFTYTITQEASGATPETLIETATVDTPSVTSTAANLSLGTYRIDVTAVADATGAPLSTLPLCMATDRVQITGPDTPITVSEDEVIQPTCVNMFGTIRVSAMGGTPPFTFELTEAGAPTTIVATNTNGFFGSALNLGDGTYTVTIRDSKNCVPATPLIPIEITTPNNPTVTLMADVVVSCPDDSATLTATAMMGAVPAAPLASIQYTLTRTNMSGGDPVVVQGPQATGVFNNVQAGEAGEPNYYVATVRDANGCIAASTPVVTVEKPTAISIERELIIDITCDDSRATRGGVPVRTAQYEITASGGTGTSYTVDLLSSNPLLTTPTVVETTTVVGAAPAVFELESGANYIRVTNSPNGCEAFTTINVGESPEDIDFSIIATTELLCPGETGSVVLEAVSGGLPEYTYELFVVTPSGGSFTEVVGPLNGATTPVARRENDTQFFDLVDINTLTGLPSNATYAYKISSEGMCIPAYRTFEINQRAPLTFTSEASEISCAGEEDGSITITIDTTNGVGPYTVTIIPEEGVSGSEISDNTINATSTFDIIQGVALNVPVGENVAAFMNLAPADYRVLISDLGTGCNVMPGLETIENKQELLVTELTRMAPDCRGDNDGMITFEIQFGTPPYYYEIVENRDKDTDPEPDPITIVGNANIVDTPTSTDINGNDIYAFDLSALSSEVDYEVFVVDSGNRQMGANLIVCEAKLLEFRFETPDLNQFTAEAMPDCPITGVSAGTYTITLDNVNENLDPSLISYTATRTSDGAIFISNAGSDQILGVEEGVYTIVMNYEVRPGVVCTSEVNSTLGELVPFTKVQFDRDLTTDAGTFAPYVPLATKNVNVYQLVATGGRIADGDLSPYIFSGSFIRNATDDTNFAQEIVINPDGTFEITEGGWYTFTVTDKFNTACFDIAAGIPLDFMDVDIPNVFNPDSGDPGTSTWYPDDITVNTPEGEIISTTVIVTTGGTTVNGVTTGGTTTITTTRAGITAVSVATNTTIVGGTVNTGGVITGGVISGGSEPVPTFADVSVEGGVTTVTIITGGETTGGTTSGGITTTGGTTTGGTVIDETIVGGETTGGTTTGGTTTGGVSTGVTVSVITIDNSGAVTDGSNNSSVVVTTGVTVTGGTLLGGTTSGGTTTGGVTSGGTMTGTVITDGTTTGGVVTGGTTSGGVIFGGTITGGTTTSTINTGQTTVTMGGSGEVVFEEFSNMEVMIFDRYGRLLEEFKGIKQRRNGEGWNGTYKGTNMPSGDYWYLIKLNDDQGREFTGHFTLYRKQ